MGDAIEQERKLQEQIKLTNYDMIVSEKILNFHTPPPVIRPAIEQLQDHRFLISDLIRIQRELQALTNFAGLIETKDFLRYLSVLTKYAPGLLTLPDQWKKLSVETLEETAARFDPQLTGKVSMRQIFTMICLQASAFPFGSQLEDYRAHLEHQAGKQILQAEAEGEEEPPVATHISMEAFLETEAFFDQKEKQHPDEEHSRSTPFERLRHLKTLLFECNGNTKKVDLDQPE